MVTTREITYDADGRRQFAHLARPEGPGPWPTVLIGHEGIGLNDYQRRRADALAGHGYLALAMDYHGGRWFSDPQEMVAATVPLVGDPPGCGRLAAIGYGAGGTIALEMGRDGVDLRGIAAINPAAPPPAPHDTAAIRGAVLIGVGSEDPIVTPEQLLVFTRELQAAGVDWRLTVYGGAEHAFHHPPESGPTHTQTVLSGVAYDPTQAPRAWRDVLDLLAEALSV